MAYAVFISSCKITTTTVFAKLCVNISYTVPVSLLLTNSHSSSLKFFNTIHGLPRTKTIIIMDKQHMKMGLFCQHLF